MELLEDVGGGCDRLVARGVHLFVKSGRQLLHMWTERRPIFVISTYIKL